MNKNKVLSIVNSGLLLVSLMIIVVSSNVSVSGQIDNEDLLKYEWPMMGADVGRTHFSAGPAPSSPDVLWKKEGISGAPTAFNGKIFSIVSNRIIALEPFTGTVIYNVTVPPIPDRNTRVSELFKIDEVHMGVLVQSDGSDTEVAIWAIRVFNIADGTLIWSDPDPKLTGPRAAADFTYVAEEKMAYVAIGNETGRGSRSARATGILQGWDLSDPTSLTLVWTYLSDGSIARPMYGDGKLFPSGSEPRQLCLDPKTGNVIWETQLTGTTFYIGTYYDGKVLRGLLDNSFVALNANTGEILWSVRPSPYGFWSSGPAAGYGMVFMANVDGFFYAFNATTGDINWKYQGPGLFYPSYTKIADGKVYTCTGQPGSPLTPETAKSEYTCFDAYTGKVLWQLEEEFSTGPGDYAAIAYGNFYGVNTRRSDRPANPTLICYGSPKNWSMFLGDPANTATGFGGPANATLKWKFTTNGVVRSSPTIVNGKVYFGSYDKNWYCLDARTGSMVWKFTVDHYIRSSAAVVDGKVYTGADDGFVYCLDADTGQQLWKAAVPGSVLHIICGTQVQWRSSPTVVDGKLYVGALDGKLYCLDANTGNEIWTKQTTGAILSTPTYIVNDGLYFASVDGFVYKLDASNGNVIWNLSTPIGRNIQMMGTPVVGGGKVFIGSGAAGLSPAGVGQFYGIDSTTGELIWQTNELPGSGQLEPIWSMHYIDDKVYYADFFSFSCSNATTGEKLWTTFLTREQYGTPAYADGKFYCPSIAYGVYIVDQISGDKMAHIGVPGLVYSSPAIYENKLYFGCDDWNLYCYEESSSGTIYGDQPAEPQEPSPSTPIEPEEPTEPEQPAKEAPLISTEVAIIVAVVVAVVIGIAAYWTLRKRQ